MLDVEIKKRVNAEELDRLQQRIHAFDSGELNEDRFTPIRLQQGVYGQRQPDVYMLRVKVPGGTLSAPQLIAIADVAQRFSAPFKVHLTTRQDVQIYNVALQGVPEALRGLATVGLTSREACGNTVRNITACVLAGVCPYEHTDVRHYVERTTRQFLRHPLTQQLPRKFKMSFSGCEADCAQGLIHDLAAIATWQGDTAGFKVLVGGGLGHKPRQAIELESFVPREQLTQCIEAVLWVHNRHSNRRLRARSRIKFLLDQYGEAGFKERYQQALQRLQLRTRQEPKHDSVWQQAGATPASFQVTDYSRYPLSMRQADTLVVPLHIPLGDISGAHLRGIAGLMETYTLQDVRVTQDQNLLLAGVKNKDKKELYRALKALGLADMQAAVPVACPGTESCRLGITHSQGIARLLTPARTGGLRVHIAGCQNGCAQPEIADVGLYGEGKRLHGYLLPFYQTWLGGRGAYGEGFAIKGPSVPAQRVAPFIERVQRAFVHGKKNDESFYQWSRQQQSGFFQTLAHDFYPKTENDASLLAKDIESQEPFRVEQFGGGECAGVADAFMDACLTEMRYEQMCRDSEQVQNNDERYLQSLENTLAVCAGVVLFIFDANRKEQYDREQWLPRLSRLQNDAPIVCTLQAYYARYQTLRSEGIAQALEDFSSQLDEWLRETFTKKALYGLLAASLGSPRDAKKTIDLTGYACPMHYLKARQYIQSIHSGTQLIFRFVSGDPAQQAIDSLIKDGHQVKVLSPKDNGTPVQVRKI